MTDGETDFDTLLQFSKDFHGGVCPGIVMGTRMTIAAMRELRLNVFEKNSDLIVYVEIDRCMADAVQALTGCSLGKRTLKYQPYGKFAATFVNTKTGKAVRVSTIDTPNNKQVRTATQDIVKKLSEVPETDLLRVERVNVTIPEEDLPGLPKHRETCSKCGEQILDSKEVRVGDEPTCKNCANGSYYTSLDMPSQG
jgi:formylmethanofuran dehydrogenase subunit E